MSRIGIIGGSGLYDIPGIESAQWKKISSPFGDPSDDLLFGTLKGQDFVFLPRHGRGHPLSPSEINYRANIDALKRAGASCIISLSAVGSLREAWAPGCFLLVDQYIDRTHGRKNSFFDGGCVAHVSMADPTCTALSEHIHKIASSAGIDVHPGATYLAMEGPQFSTRAESALYRSWNCDVIGMTNMPEAKLAREAELCYASIAMVTDYDCWHPEHDHVTVEQIIRTLSDNAEKARRLMGELIPNLHAHLANADCACRHALDHALITATDRRSPELIQALDAVAGRVLNA